MDRGLRQRRPGKPTSEGDTKASLGEEEAVRRASRGWVQWFVVAFVAAIVLSFAVLCLIPSPVNVAMVAPLPEPPAMEGPLAPNDILAKAEKIYVGHVSGAESLVVDGDYIYTGTADGWVSVLHQGKVRRLVTFGQEPCGGIVNENTCGRPLGLRMGADGMLVVLDAYYGLFKVNVVTGDYTTLYSSKTPVNGKVPKLLNDLDIGPDGTIYFTDTSTRFGRNQFVKILFEMAGTGRLLQYSPITQTVTQLLDGLVFANGVQLTKDKSSVLVAETLKARILRYDLKTGVSSVWADNLPGIPDNIRYSKHSGTYWVGFPMLRQKGKFSVFDFLVDKAWLRGMMAKVMDIKGFFTMRHFTQGSQKPVAMVVELDQKGQIIRSLQDYNGELFDGMSEVESSDQALYFGSFHAPYIGRLYKQNIPKK